MMSPAALDTLVSAACAGDERAFAKLSDHYRRRLLAHCYRIVCSVEDSEDLVQETFLRAWQSRASFRGPSYAAWLYRIATNVCMDALKRRRRRPAIAAESRRVGGARAHSRNRGGAARDARQPRDGCARLLGRRPAPPAAPARRARAACRARLVLEGRGAAARVERRLGQQRAPAGAPQPVRQVARAAARVGLGARS